jgi:hypothetical protein
MQESPPSASSESTSMDLWKSFACFVTPPVAASLSNLGTIYGFIAKSALQKGEGAPRMTPRSCLLAGIKTSPTIGAIVGTQMIAQRVLEKILNGEKSTKKSATDFSSILFSTVVIGAVSAPLLAVFNGQTMGWNPMKALRMLSVRQAGAIVSRETGFLCGLRLSDPLAGAMQSHFGEGIVVDYTAAFFSGSVGALAGHPADTMLTLSQRGEKLARWSHLMRGGLYRSVAVGLFGVIYKAASRALDPESQK